MSIKKQEQEKDAAKNKTTNRRMNFREKVESSKLLILSKLDELKSLNEKLRTGFVPASVISNLKKTIKDIDVTYFLFRI